MARSLLDWPLAGSAAKPTRQAGASSRVDRRIDSMSGRRRRARAVREYAGFGDQQIHPPLLQRAQRLFGPIDDRLFVGVERGVDRARESTDLLEAPQDIVIGRVVLSADHLRARGSIDVDHRGDAVA